MTQRLPVAAILTVALLCPAQLPAQDLPQLGPRFQAVRAAMGDAPQQWAALARVGARVTVVRGTLPELEAYALQPEVTALELAAPLRLALAEGLGDVNLPPLRADRGPGGGKGVVIGLVDTGIDVEHAGFQGDGGTSRIEWVLDLSAPIREGAHPELELYGGAVWARGDLTPDAEDLPRDVYGHGTHVAGIAAGRGSQSSLAADGVAPEATLISVRATRDDGLYLDDADVLTGIDFVLDRAEALGLPVVVNLSLGGHAGPHDGTSLFEEALTERFSNRPGRVLVTAIGNDGDRDIHASGPLRGAEELVVRVPEAPAVTGSGAALVEVWYTLADRPVVGPTNPVVVWLETPDGRRTEPASLGQSVREISPTDGIVAVTHARGGAALGQVVLFLQEPADGPLPMGDYTLHLDGGDGCFDAWVASSGSFGAHLASHLDPDERLSVPATAPGAIAVGGYAGRDTWESASGTATIQQPLGGPARFTATGPTGDGRPRPDVLAPGLLVASTMSQHAAPGVNARSLYAGTVAAGFDPVLPDSQHAVASGTSMAAPFATGTAALLLERDPNLTSEQVRGILRATADGHAAWDPRRGFGVLDIRRAAAAQEARASAPLDVEQTRVAISRDVIEPKESAYVIVVPVGVDGLPLAANWGARVTVVSETGSAVVGEPTKLDEAAWQFPVHPGTARGAATVHVEIDGDRIPQTPRVWFGTREQLGTPGGEITGSGCAATSRSGAWLPWRRR